MNDFLSAFGHAFINRTVWLWTVVGVFSALIGLVLDFLVWRKPKLDIKMRWLRATPFIIFVILLLFTLTVAIPYNMWQTNQNDLQNEIQKNTKLQQQLTAITKLNIVSLPITGKKMNSPDSASVTITVTPYFNPAYSSIIPEQIQNPDPSNHVFEIIRLKVSPAEFKFTTIDTTNLPTGITILDEYSGTDNVTVIINDFAPLESTIINFPVYTMDNDQSIYGTENLSMIVLDSRILP